MSIVSTRCPRDYVRDPSQSNWNLNDIPILDQGDVYQLYFPRPWVIVGLSDLQPVPGGGATPSYDRSYANFLTPTAHGNNSDMFLTVFLDLAYATMHEYDPSYLINYVEPGIQGKDYRGYFTKYLSSASLVETRQWYNSVIEPESVVKKFCDANAGAATDDVWLKNWFEMVRFLEDTMWPSFMGAPGIYTIGKGSGQASPDWDSVTYYEQHLNN
jgi:hypothetical protein